MVDYVDGIADWKAAGLRTEGNADIGQRVIDATRSDVPVCRPDDTIGEIRPNVVDLGWDICVVTDCDGMTIGRIRGAAFDDAPGRPVHEVMEPGPSTVRGDQLLQPLVQRMKERNVPNVIATTPQGRLLGLLIRDEADRLLAGDPPQQIWRDCECCPGGWAEASTRQS